MKRSILIPPRISLRAALRVWQRNMTVYRHTWKINILPNFFEPVLYLLSLGIGLAVHIKSMAGVPYMAFITPGLISSQAMMGASFEVTYNCFIKAYRARTYDALMCTPVMVEEIAAGEILWATTRATLYGVIFLAVLVPFGLVNSWWALAVIPAVVLTGVFFAALGLTFTAVVTRIDLYSFYFTLFLTPLFLFSGIFYPISSMPVWVQKAAWCTPLFHSVQMMRDLVVTGPNLGTLVHGALLLAGALLFCVLALNLLKRRLVS